MSKVFVTLTGLCIFGLMPSFGYSAPMCSSMFSDVETTPIQNTIESHLGTLRKSLSELRSALKENKKEKNRLQALSDLADDPRETSYILQGAYRLMLSHPKATEIFNSAEITALQKGLKMVKNLEKTLGSYQVQADLYKMAAKLDLPADFLSYLESTRNKFSKKIIQELTENDFLDKEISQVNKHMKRLEQWNTDLGSSAVQLLKESLQSEISRVHEKVLTEMKPLIMKNKYDSHDLENGAHAFRRSLRWLKVYLVAYSDYFYTKDSSAFERVNSKKQIEIDSTQFKLLVKSIEKLRKIKKPGEIREKLSQALVDYAQSQEKHLSQDEALSYVNNLMHEKFDNIEEKTQEILKTYESQNGFESLISP